MIYDTNELIEQCFKTFETLFPKELFAELENQGQRCRKFPPLVTLKGFMFQCMSPEHSCRSALVFILSRFKILASLKTTAYCRSRAKLQTKTLKALAISSGKNLIQASHRVFWVDGTIFQMWDSDANRNEFPHSPRQKIGLGQPVLRALGLFCSQTGAFLDVEFGKFIGKGQAETSLLRKVLDRLLPGDVLVMDRFFTSVYLLQQIRKREIHFVVRLRESVALKIFKENRISCGDGFGALTASYRSSYNEDQGLGKSLEVRVIKSKIQRKGFRTKNLYLATSLFEAKRHEIESNYADRWGIEVAYRNLKKTMGLRFIKAKTPEMVEKEIWVTLMTYNLIICAVNLTKPEFKS